ncbi:OmpA family protein [Flammeovirga aprica]|uniref:OmpA family protein n=1 Tax=Flammeovirga aprica JL-4 TaxID=694437 RepID=A0A7X9P411_9BACT|nr:OmpA family protein [Flammeovirga aprica]NME68307.1 OmpA family protein [Flammeovirga aprica JL-4]
MKSSTFKKYFFFLYFLTCSYCFASNKVAVHGVVYSHKSKIIDNVEVVVYSYSEQKNMTLLTPIKSTFSDKDGKFELELENHSNYQIKCFKNGWTMDNNAIILAKEAHGTQKIKINCRLKKADNTYELLGELHQNKKDKYRVELFNPNSNTIITLEEKIFDFKFLLDQKGDYILKVINQEDHILYMNRIEINQSVSKIIIDLPDDQKKRFAVYPFTVNTSNINEKAHEELNLIVERMKEKKNIDVKIECHTDSRGDDDFNLKISQEQAKSIKNYLILQGVSSERIFIEGFGENFLLNGCKNNVKCSNLKHLENRRVEYLFLVSSTR